MIICKSCGFSDYVKSGFAFGKQRYKCKKCGTFFREGDARQKYSTADHLKVIKLYLENCGIRTIERLTGIRNSQISKWIESAASYVKLAFERTHNNLNSIQEIEILELDELCTYIKKDQKMAENLPSYGLLLIDGRIKLLILK